jgi:hypothetical protein
MSTLIFLCKLLIIYHKKRKTFLKPNKHNFFYYLVVCFGTRYCMTERVRERERERERVRAREGGREGEKRAYVFFKDNVKS